MFRLMIMFTSCFMVGKAHKVGGGGGRGQRGGHFQNKGNTSSSYALILSMPDIGAQLYM